MKLVVTTNGEKSAEVIVPRQLQMSWEGLNFRPASYSQALMDKNEHFIALFLKPKNG